MDASFATAEPGGKKPFYRQLYVQVLAAIAAGILLGHFYPELGANLKPLGDAFIKLVKMIIAPVIFLTVATGIAGMSDLQKIGRVAGKAMIYFLVFSTLALAVGLVVSNVVQPGAGMHIDVSTLDTSKITTASCSTSFRPRSLVPSPKATSCRSCSSPSCSASHSPWSAIAAAPSMISCRA
jgi:aerobic C4-dicarboxylate transport protein